MAVLVLAEPAHAQGSDEGAATGDIVVTARRVEERLQDVPISITVLDQRTLSNRNIAIATDLTTFTPSLQVNQRFGPEKANFAIRGFNQESATAPSVGVYFADVVGVRAQAGTTSGNTIGAGAFMDLQNVQVLKGPQGTLFGRNTTGGAILLVPNKPTDRLEGWVEGTIGDYDLWSGKGVLNVPLSDSIRIRAAVDRTKRDGYMKNKSDRGPDSLNDLNYFAGRLSLGVDFTPDIENVTVFSYSNSFARGYGSRLVGCNPTTAASAVFTRAPGCEQVRRQAARGDSLHDIDVAVDDPKISIRQWQIINTTTWKASDSLTIKNIASYGEFRERSLWNLYSTNFTFQPGQAAVPASAIGKTFEYTTLYRAPDGNTSDGRSFTEELQLQGTSFGDRLNWQIGGYLEFSRPKKFSTSYVVSLSECLNEAQAQAIACSNDSGRGGLSYAKTRTLFDNHGIYGQGTFKITDQLSFTAGIRYTFDKIHAIGESTRFQAINTPNQNQICQDVLRFYEKNPDGTPRLSATGARQPLGTFSGRFNGANAADTHRCHNEIDNNSNRPTWLLEADYKPTPDTMLYAKWARGYRQGGINFGNIGLETWGPEKLDAYEVGAKLTFRGAVNGYFNVAGFYNNFSDQQISASAGSKDFTVISGASAIINAGRSKIKGIEVDSSVTLFDSLRFDVGYTYLEAKLTQLNVPVLPPESPFSVLSPRAVVGQALNQTPKHRLTITGTYTLPIADSAGRLDVGATLAYTSKQIFSADVPAYVRFSDGCPTTNCLANGPAVTHANTPDAIPFGVIDPVTLVNLNVNWTKVMGSDVDLAFFITNLTNKTYIVANGGGYNSAGFGDVLVGAPRMYGMRIRVNFGR